MKAVFGAGQQGSAAVPITAGIAALGAGVYYLGRSKPETTPEQDRRGRAEAKKAEGLSGAGIGGNAVTGGHELSHANSDRKEGTTAPFEKLPSGGVGGGVGGGGSNVRTSVEMSGKKQAGTSSTSHASGMLGGLFNTGGSKTDDGSGKETKDTRVASNYDGTPTKRDATHHDQHQPRVDKPGGNDSDNKGKGGSNSNSNSNSNSSDQSARQSFQGAFGQGGDNVAERGDQSQGFRDPRVASNHTETPTKRGPN
ncbi:hypothetical protein F53441_1692 [Fusarium austroafricanum]|uniref:Uncharacterized protein n=1 Tax=Fusarium austroafricanum TaxID=2364996 RepID=A0A8H4PCW7_9HYPO|nr:hypothetical protein F53441_1692 [Fusarium austroafricanum]